MILGWDVSLPFTLRLKADGWCLNCNFAAIIGHPICMLVLLIRLCGHNWSSDIHVSTVDPTCQYRFLQSDCKLSKFASFAKSVVGLEPTTLQYRGIWPWHCANMDLTCWRPRQIRQNSGVKLSHDICHWFDRFYDWDFENTWSYC